MRPRVYLGVVLVLVLAGTRPADGSLDTPQSPSAQSPSAQSPSQPPSAQPLSSQSASPQERAAQLNARITELEETLGRDHPDVASALNQLAIVYFTQGDFAAAEPLLRRALAIREAALGLDDP